MALQGPQGPATGRQQGDRAPDATPFDLGDSRDLAAAVRAAWASGPESTLRPSSGAAPGEPRAEADPLAHLRGEVARRSPRPALALPAVRRSTLLASLGVAAAVVAAAAFPVVSGGTPRPTAPIADERERPTTSTSRPASSTTAFTYPPETFVPPDTAPPPAVVAPPAPAAGNEPDRPAPTATTARPRTATTARRQSSPTTRAPAPTTTTTQAPPPPPDDGDSGDPGQPPPYP